MSREIDAIVAEKVMGWVSNYPGGWPHPPMDTPNRKQYMDSEGCTVIPNYSSSIEAAWQIIEKLITQGHYVNIFSTEYSTPTRENGPGWGCQVSSDDTSLDDTAPMAICLAALKTVGHRL